jgi:LacI family transcriptional regulator/LacI family repressor for deo operon, udp, cdd, tsx, nupC, and nupG
MARVVSIKDIAKAAGVSYSTVSRALNDSPLISQEVRQRIQGLARSMGYTPNALAQSLLSRLTHSIGLVITTISDPFFVDVVKGIDEVAQDADFSVLLSTSNNDPEREIKIIELFNRRRVDGVIVAASRMSRDYADRLARIDIPVIMINNQAYEDQQNLYSISIDDYAGGRAAVEHLLKLGHRKIGYLGVENRPASNSLRFDGYLDAFQDWGVPVQKEWIYQGESSTSGDLAGDLQAGKSLGSMLLESGVTAVFCYCDTVAAGLLLACRECGIDVPGQLSIVGFDDNELCEIVFPPLTTIAQPKQEMGQLAMRMLLENLSGAAVKDVVVQPSLLVRGSTAQILTG